MEARTRSARGWRAAESEQEGQIKGTVDEKKEEKRQSITHIIP